MVEGERFPDIKNLFFCLSLSPDVIKKAAVFTLLGKCAIGKMIFKTKSHAFDIGGNLLLWKNRVTTSLSVSMMTSIAVHQNICLISLKAKYDGKSSLALKGTFFSSNNCFGNTCYWGIGSAC